MLLSVYFKNTAVSYALYWYKKNGTLKKKGEHHVLNKEIQGILVEDLDKKIPEPKIVAATKSRQYYLFE